MLGWLSFAVTILTAVQIPLCYALFRIGNAVGKVMAEFHATQEAVADHAREDETRFKEVGERFKEFGSLIEMLRARTHDIRKEFNNHSLEVYNALDARLRRLETGRREGGE